MAAVSVMGLFCEDIREEKSGTITLVGILPDNANLAMPQDQVLSAAHDQIVLAKVCVYVRVNFDPDDVPSGGPMRLVLPNGNVVALGNIDTATLDLASKQAKEKGNPMAGIISRVVMGGFNPGGPGVVKLEVTLGEQIFIAAAINFHIPEKAEAASISPTAH